MTRNDLDRLVTPSRVRNYCLMLIAAYVLGAAIWLGVLAANDWVDPQGKPLGYDFLAFYAASSLAAEGDAASAFDLGVMFAREVAIVPGSTSILPWFYPPPFQLMIAPLAMAPYGVALAAWLAATFALYLAMVRRISDHPWTLLIAGAFPPVFLNAMNGQNGFLTAGLLGLGLLWLERRPWAAGICIGLMVCKPQLAVLLPLLLAVQGRWKTFAAAGLTVVAVSAAAFAAYGAAPWAGFLGNLSFAAQALEGHGWPWEKMPSIFVMASGLGAPREVAYLLHATVAVSLAVLTLDAWRRPGPQALKIALAVPAMLAVSPYAYDYDLTILALPIGLLADHGRRAALPAGGRAVLVLAFFTPIALTAIAGRTGLQLMPIGLLLLYGLAWLTLAQARSGRVLAMPPAAARA